MIQNICIIAPGYPSVNRPYEFTFIDQLACAIADKGIRISVITPHDSIKRRSFELQKWTRKTPNDNYVDVYSPAVLTLSTRKIGLVNFSYFSESLFIKACIKTINDFGLKPDILYAHFLFKSGTCAAFIGAKLRIPSICAFGESSLWSIREIGIKKAREKLASINGFIAVSTNNKKVLIENHLATKDIINTIPNAVNKSVFCPGNKTECRRKLGLPQDGIIGIYNGAFNYSKGSLRVDTAVKGINGLSMVYLGGGKEEPHGDSILFKGRVAHEDVPTWLKAADFFILPTLEEGCCNAIIEAMSTGLPIITSNLPFNYDILDNESAMLVDPLDIEKLHDSVQKLTNSADLRKHYSEAAIRKSENLDISIRADRIIAFLNQVQSEYNR